MTFRLISVDAVQALQKELIDRYGGSHGLRDLGLLESAVARAEMKIYYEPDASLGEVAAALGYGLIKNHAFIDGNKRIGLAAMVTFLAANGQSLSASQQQQVEMVQNAAANLITQAEWTAWVVLSLKPRP